MDAAALLSTIREESKDRLPVVPASVTHLLQVLGEEDIGLRPLAKVIENYSTIAMRIIGLANSAWSSPVTPITAVEPACARLGFRVVRSVSIALAIAEPFNPALCSDFDKQQFWLTSLLRAEAASMLGSRVPEDTANTARTAALLSNIGLLWLADYMPEQTGRALSMVRDDPSQSVNDATRQCCGFGYDIAGSALAMHWKLPEVLVSAIAQQHHRSNLAELDPVAQILAASVHLAHAASAGEPELSGQDALSPWVADNWPDFAGIYARLLASRSNAAQMAETLFGN
jgi:HD-like signal output (HDOD) protein